MQAACLWTYRLNLVKLIHAINDIKKTIFSLFTLASVFVRRLTENQRALPSYNLGTSPCAPQWILENGCGRLPRRNAAWRTTTRRAPFRREGSEAAGHRSSEHRVGRQAEFWK
jgi:hypothetical protein